MKEPQVGDVVHFSRFLLAGRYTAANIWAVIIRAGTQPKFCMFHNVPEEWTPADDPTDSFTGGDEWEIVHPDKWPEDVCVALAKWRLTQ